MTGIATTTARKETKDIHLRIIGAETTFGNFLINHVQRIKLRPASTAIKPKDEFVSAIEVIEKLNPKIENVLAKNTFLELFDCEIANPK